MSNNSVLRAFFVGKAVANVLQEKTEEALSDALSELGKFDAEQRERLRQFSEEVLSRAEREMTQRTSATSPADRPSASSGFQTSTSSDLQETIDELRAEIAQTRAQLTAFRSQQT
ncbi:MAG: hypothetical protein SVX43_09575 [Cyanobacteriota bacterium]|nr:hypothetical protein [Cyanobacteriota bacterium]